MVQDYYIEASPKLVVVVSDKAGKRLPATFSLFTYENKLKRNLVLDANGEIEIDDLEAGAYSIMQTASHCGYSCTSETKDFVLEEYKTTVIQFFNEMID